MKFAADVAKSGCLGLDMDLSRLSPEERAATTATVATYKQFRDVITSGDLYLP